MFRATSAALFLCSVAALAAPAPRVRHQDVRPMLLGVWQAERWESEGRSTFQNEARFAPRVEVTAASLTIQKGTLCYPMRYTLRPSESPAHIDLTYVDGPDKGKTVKGLYKL